MIIVLLGESGSGKSTLEQELCKSLGYSRIKSTTSRPIRSIENGDEYNFVSDEKFNEMLLNDEFLEYAKYNGWQYGLSQGSLKEDAVVVLTPHGLRTARLYLKRKGLEDKYKIFAVYLKVDRKSRLIKLIESRGEDQIEESYRRSLSDIGMFDGIEDEVDLVLNNSEYRMSVETLAEQVKQELESRGEL